MKTHARRLNALMDTRRLELGLRWKGVVERAGITHQTLLQLRKGQAVADFTVSRVEQALEWAPGSIARIMEGGDPHPTSSDASAEDEGEDRLDGPIADLLDDGESLTWWQTPLGRTYRLESATPGYAVEAGFGANEQPEDVIDDLRQLLESTLAQAEVLAKRRSGGRRARRP
ncbi:hypothetical protein [Lipingzhangella halophila]|nr:hypothetical protein [Lipingzhangella halophila]